MQVGGDGLRGASLSNLGKSGLPLPYPYPQFSKPIAKSGRDAQKKMSNSVAAFTLPVRDTFNQKDNFLLDFRVLI